MALCEHPALQLHIPSGMLRDCNSLWNKTQPACLGGVHLCSQIVLPMLFTNSKLQAPKAQGLVKEKLGWRPAGTISAV